MYNYFLVFVGGGLGSVLRYSIGLYFRNTLSQLPVATFLANLIACLLFAVFLMLSRNTPSEKWSVFILTGLCGGLSTFSTFSYETYLLMKQGLHAMVALNVAGSLLVCLGAFYLVLK